MKSIFHFCVATVGSMLTTSFMKPSMSFPFVAAILFDVGLTSTIAFSFAVNGLIDIGVFKDHSLGAYVVGLIFWVYQRFRLIACRH